MNREQQLKLQAFLDGELPEWEAREVAAWIQHDCAAATLLEELKNTRQALFDYEPELPMSEAREFYWSKIEREIQKLESEEKQTNGRAINWGHVLWPIGAAAVCFIVVLLETARTNHLEKTVAFSANTDGPVVVTVQPDSDATTYCDEASGTTLVWFTGPTDVSSNSVTPSAATF
jgi:anti-sigma factor RsiW